LTIYGAYISFYFPLRRNFNF